MGVGKLKSSSGSAMGLAIIIMAVVAIIVPIILFQNINQIKSTDKSKTSKALNYALESGVDKTIGEACRQIEAKVPLSLGAVTTYASVSTNTYSISSNMASRSSRGKFSGVTSEIQNVLSAVENINGDTANLKLKLQGITSKSYTDIDSLVNDIVSVKNEAIKTSGSLGYNNQGVRQAMYNIIGNINNTLELTYQYRNEGKTPFEFRDNAVSDWNQKQANINWNQNQISNLFIDDSASGNSYGVGSILKNQLSGAMDNVKTAQNLLGGYPYQNATNAVGDKIIFGIINKINTDYLNGGSSPIPGRISVRNELIVLSNHMWNYSITDEAFKNQKKNVCQSIDGVIAEINKAQVELYKLYTEKQSPDTATNKSYDDIISKMRPEILKAINAFDIAKRNLIETKFMLGESFTPPADIPIVNDPHYDTSDVHKILIPKQVYTLDSNKATVEEVSKDINSVYDVKSGNLKSIGDITIDIISSDASTKKRLESKVIISSSVSNGKIVTSYKIVSQD